VRPLLLALLSALLFGASTPASKVLLDAVPPLQLAGLLYLGAAFGVAPAAWRDRRDRRDRSDGGARGAARRRLDAANRRRLLGSVVFGGMVGPVLLLLALQRAASGSVALLLNLEMVATAVLGVALFKEHLGGAGWAGIAAGVLAGVVLSAQGGLPGVLAGLLVAGACVAWGLDNHCTALIDGIAPSEATVVKGLAAGATNLALGLALEPVATAPGAWAAAAGVGVLSYGVSIVLYVIAAQHLGATRAQVAFASAPFLGAGLSWLALGEALGWEHAASAALLAAGVALLVLDRHEHAHEHPATEHVHSHRHDDGHHHHAHPGLAPSVRHTHLHRHERLVHAHRHLPDLHHRHGHRHGGDARAPEAGGPRA
jgi:drug/metabolite transporter (DMT)-like permease